MADLASWVAAKARAATESLMQQQQQPSSRAAAGGASTEAKNTAASPFVAYQHQYQQQGTHHPRSGSTISQHGHQHQASSNSVSLKHPHSTTSSSSSFFNILHRRGESSASQHHGISGNGKHASNTSFDRQTFNGSPGARSRFDSDDFDDDNDGQQGYEDADDDVQSVRTTVTNITTSTMRGQPYRMQWRSPSRQDSSLRDQAGVPEGDLVSNLTRGTSGGGGNGGSFDDTDAPISNHNRHRSVASSRSSPSKRSDPTSVMLDEFEYSFDKDPPVAAARTPTRAYKGLPLPVNVVGTSLLDEMEMMEDDDREENQGNSFYGTMGIDCARRLVMVQLFSSLGEILRDCNLPKRRKARNSPYVFDGLGNAQDVKPVKVLDLSECTSVFATQSNKSILSLGSQQSGDLHEFRLTMNTKDILMATQTIGECSGWITALSMLLSRLKLDTFTGVKTPTMPMSASPPSMDGYIGGQDSRNSDEAIKIKDLEEENRRLQLELLRYQSLLGTANTDITISNEPPIMEEPPINDTDIAKAAENDDGNTTTNIIDNNITTLSEAVTNINSTIDTRATEILEAIWSANTTSIKSSSVTGAPVADLESAVVELTDSMEMRTSRIGKMVHELLNRPEVDVEGTLRKVIDEMGVMCLKRGDLNDVIQKVETIVKEGLNSKVTLEAGRSGLNNARDGQDGSQQLIKQSPFDVQQTENEPHVSLQLDRILEMQRSLSNDVEGLMGIVAESAMMQRERESDVARDVASRHDTLVKMSTDTQDYLEKIQHAISVVDERIDGKVKTIEGMVKSLAEDVKERLVDAFGGDKDDGRIGQLVVSALSDLKMHVGGAAGNENLHSRSTTVSVTTGTEELIHAKLDNILEVIDFVNKSQCRLVTIITEKVKQVSVNPTSTTVNSNQEQTPMTDEKILETVKEAILTVLKESGRSNDTKACTDSISVTAISEVLTACQELKQSHAESILGLKQFVKETINVTSADTTTFNSTSASVHGETQDHLESSAEIATSKPAITSIIREVQNATLGLESKISRTEHDAASRHDLIEEEGAIVGAEGSAVVGGSGNEPGFELKELLVKVQGTMEVGMQRIIETVEKTGSADLKRLGVGEKDVVNILSHEETCELASVKEDIGSVLAKLDQLLKGAIDNDDGARTNSHSQQLQLMGQAINGDIVRSFDEEKERFIKEIAALCKQKEELLIEIESMKKVRDELSADIEAKTQLHALNPIEIALEQLEHDLVNRIGGLVNELEGLEEKKMFLVEEDVES
ncbi:hypothetical protein HDU76_002661 [Blyttiomyces sp. JEL0837]|nr:hypothetical protein HDU76_002661 [Blyttiomyces sp. JEL0837]